MNRELHTLCTVGDLVLRGQLPEAMGTLTQRVKSLEVAWTAAQRLELLPSDTATLSSRQELKIATTEQRAEAQAHQSGAWWSKGSGKEAGKSERTDKGKGKGLRPRSWCWKPREACSIRVRGICSLCDSALHSINTGGTGVEVPGKQQYERGEDPGKHEGRSMTTGGATLKELTPVDVGPGGPYVSATNFADDGTGQ